MMVYRSAFPSVWSSPSNWKLAAVSVAPESCHISLSAISLAIAMQNPDLKPRGTNQSRAQHGNKRTKKQMERRLGTTYNANPITVNSRVNLLAVLRRRVDDGLARARFRSGRHLFLRCFVWGWSGRWKVPSFPPLFSFFLFLFLFLWGSGAVVGG
jgi:hypothetical protein